MFKQSYSHIQTWAQVVSVIIAAIAIMVTVYWNYHSQKSLQLQLEQNKLIFDAQLAHSEKLTATSIKPYLHTWTEKVINSQGQTCKIEVRLENKGQGVALISQMFAFNGLDKTTSIPSAIGAHKFIEYFTYFGKAQYIAAKDHIVLIKTSVEYLISSHGISEVEAINLILDLESRLKDIHLELTYLDALGSKEENMASVFMGERGAIIRRNSVNCIINQKGYNKGAQFQPPLRMT